MVYKWSKSSVRYKGTLVKECKSKMCTYRHGFLVARLPVHTIQG